MNLAWLFGLFVLVAILIWLINRTPRIPSADPTIVYGETYMTYIAGDGDVLKVSHTCYETHPCQHDVIVNGKKECWNVLDVYGWFYDRKMLPPPNEHIASYKDLYQERVVDWGKEAHHQSSSSS